MQKIKSITMYWFFTVIIGAAMFFLYAMQTNAAENSGSEVYFTHTHTGSCYGSVSASCGMNHSVRAGTEYRNFHCSKCQAMTSHFVKADTYYCPDADTRWQRFGSAACTICGDIHSTWDGGNPSHTYTRQECKCGIGEGEQTLGVHLSADNAWTNSGVTITAVSNILKQDLTNNGNISYSWGGTTYTATENGTYSLDVTNSSGSKITASITITNIDKITPVISSVQGDTAGMTQNSILVTVSAADSESGLADAAYSFDNGGTWTGSASFTVTEGASVSCLVRDKAGNTAQTTITRGQFPYPPKPAPTPAPAPVVTPAPAPPSIPSTPTAAPQSPVATVNPSNQTSGTASSTVTKPTPKPTPNPTPKPTPTASPSPMPENEALTVPILPSDTPFTDSDSSTSQREKSIFTISRIGEETTGREDKAPEKRKGADTLTAPQTIKESTENQSAGFLFFLERNGITLIGWLLVLGSIFFCGRLLWLHSVILYCYNGGEEFRKLGLLYLKKGKKEYELFLPDYLLETAETPRYRLLIKNALVKHHGKRDLVVRSEEHKVRQSLEECVDFVL